MLFQTLLYVVFAHLHTSCLNILPCCSAETMDDEDETLICVCG